MLVDLLCDFVSPGDLLVPDLGFRCYWGDPNDYGITVVNEEHETVAFIEWPVLRDIVGGIRGARCNAGFDQGLRHAKRIKRMPVQPETQR
jgi:hypothetical protein